MRKTSAQVICAVGLVVTCAVSVGLAESKKPVPLSVASPLMEKGTIERGLVAELELDQRACREIKRHSNVCLLGFPAAPGECFDLELEQFAVTNPDTQFACNGADLVSAPDVVLLRGKVLGDPESRVFLGLSPQGSNGYITTAGETYIISTYPRDPRRPEHRATVSYLRGALPPTDAGWECVALPTPPRQVDLVHDAGGAGGGIASDTCLEAVVAIETDYEFYQIFGDEAAANAYIVQLVAAVSDIYERDVNVQLVIGFSRLWTTAADPYESSGTDELYEFRDYWNTYMTHIDRATAHLLSGKGGGGVAWVEAICYTEYAYALSNVSGGFPQPVQSYNSGNWDLHVVAHEWGHNFGSYHTHDYGIDTCDSDCGGGPHPGTIMSYCHICPGGEQNIGLQFHDYVQGVISSFVPIAGCITDPISCDFIHRGDLNCDGMINNFDIDPFVLILSDMGAYQAQYPDCDGAILGDMNSDAAVDNFDIDGFVDALIGL